MDQPQKKSSTPDDFDKVTNIFTLEELFTIPLKAVIDANAYAAQTALDFIIRYGFNAGVPNLPDSNRFLGNLRMATFLYNYVDDTGRQKTMEINIPFISLIPIPMLEVKRAQFDYAIQILSQDYREKKEENISNNIVKHKSILALMSPVDTALKDDKTIILNNSLKANMTVKIDVEKSDLPAGVLQLLNLGQEAIKGKTERPPQISASPAEIHFRSSDKMSLLIHVSKEVGDGLLEPLENVEVMIEVTSSFGKISDLFAAPVKVTNGIEIGQPSSKKAVAKTVSAGKQKGIVEFLFTRKQGTGKNVNGFIIVRANGAQDKLVYFNFA